MDGIHQGKLKKQTNSLLTNKVYRKREKKVNKNRQLLQNKNHRLCKADGNQ